MEPKYLNTYTDTHCHLDFERFDADRSEVIRRAWDAGLVRILNPGIDLETSAAAIRLSAECIRGKSMRLSAFTPIMDRNGRRIRFQPCWNRPMRQASSRSVKLDWITIGNTPLMTSSGKFFRKQLNLAAEVNLPVIIHNVKRAPT